MFMNTRSFMLYHILKIKIIDPYGTRGSAIIVIAILDSIQKTNSF